MLDESIFRLIKYNRSRKLLWLLLPRNGGGPQLTYQTHSCTDNGAQPAVGGWAWGNEGKMVKTVHDGAVGPVDMQVRST